jgi:hypothetical protein
MNEGNLWRDTMFRGLYVFPVLGDLLNTRVEIKNDDIHTVVLEAFRLAAVLYVNNLRSRFGLDTLSADPLYATKLRNCISTSPFKQKAPSRFLLWVLAVASTSQFISKGQEWFVVNFMEVLATESITSFEELKSTLVEVVWDENLLNIETKALRTFF